MNWLKFLFHARAVVHIAANVVVMLIVFSAFKHTKQRAFQFIFFAALLDAIQTILDGMLNFSVHYYIAVCELLVLLSLSSVIFSVAGIISLTKEYLKQFQIRNSDATPVQSGGASLPKADVPHR